jgi:undecaprenyl-diphosphatase
MIFFSGELTWVPFYLILLFLIIRKYQWQSLLILLFVAVLISLSDQLSVRAFKFVFERPRPCHDSDLQPLIHLPSGECGGAFGFVSSHAANSFALAGFVWFLLRQYYSKIGWILFLWASGVAYSRVYLGVHYPGDILGGALLGLAVSWLVWQLYRRSCGARIAR